MTAYLVRNLLFPLHEALLRRPTFSYLRDLEKTQYLDREGIERLQMDRLKSLLRKAHANCPWYTRLVDEAGIDIHTDAPLTVNDLRRLPLMDKQTVREHGEKMVWRGVPGGVYPYTTGGSSGQPLRFYFGRWRQASDAAARMRARHWWDVDVGEKELFLWGAPVELNKTDRIKTLRDRLFNQLLLNAFEMSPQQMDEYADVIRRFRPSCIYGYASSIALLASHARERGTDLRIPGLKVVCTTGEPVYPHQRELIQQMFDVSVASEFGSRDGGFIAHEAPGGHLLMASESTILEVLDAAGNPVSPGQRGEGVLTGLCSEAQPFVRYRTGDMVTFSDKTDPGGRGLHVLESVDGRNTDFVIRPDGTIMHALSVIYEIRGKPGVAEFKFIQHDLKHCEVQIVPDLSWQADTSGAAVKRDLQARLGDEVSIEIKIQEQISAEASGKHRYVVSHIDLPGGLTVN